LPTFTDLGLSGPICRTLKKAGLASPTAFQQRAIPLFLHGRDLLLIAPAGPERSAGYLLALLHRLSEPVVPAQPKEPRALVLAADKDEAESIGLTLTAIGSLVAISHVVASDGSGWNRQDRALRTGVEIVVATPRRLIELLRERAVKLSAVEVVVFDAVDMLLEEGYGSDLDKVLASLPARRQTVALAADSSPALRPFLRLWMHNPVGFAAPPAAAAAPPATGSTAAARQASPRPGPKPAVTLPDWLDQPPPSLLPAWLDDKSAAAAAAPAGSGKKKRGRSGAPAPAAAGGGAQPAGKKSGGGKPGKAAASKSKKRGARP